MEKKDYNLIIDLAENLTRNNQQITISDLKEILVCNGFNQYTDKKVLVATIKEIYYKLIKDNNPSLADAVILAYHKMNEYNVQFKGYTLEKNKNNLPDYSGIYIVYCCILNDEIQKLKLTRLVYVGKAKDTSIKKCICNNNAHPDFYKLCSEGEQICYAYADVKKEDVDVIENALIYLQEPELNEDELKKHYKQPSSQFNILGECGLLNETSFEFSNEDDLYLQQYKNKQIN